MIIIFLCWDIFAGTESKHACIEVGGQELKILTMSIGFADDVLRLHSVNINKTNLFRLYGKEYKTEIIFCRTKI